MSSTNPVDPRLGEYTFEEIVVQVRNYMRYHINEKLLRGDITTNAATQRNPFIRVVPLFIKDFVVRLFYPAASAPVDSPQAYCTEGIPQHSVPAPHHNSHNMTYLS